MRHSDFTPSMSQVEHYRCVYNSNSNLGISICHSTLSQSPVFLTGITLTQPCIIFYTTHSLPLSLICIKISLKFTSFKTPSKNLPAMQKTWVPSLHWEDPLEEGMATHSSILAWRIPMDREAWRGGEWGGYSPWGRKKLDMTEQLSIAQDTF